MIIEAIKVSEDGKSIILRLFEAVGGRGSLSLTTTLPFREVHLTNLLEERIRPLNFANGAVQWDIAPFEIVTFQFS